MAFYLCKVEPGTLWKSVIFRMQKYLFTFVFMTIFTVYGQNKQLLYGVESMPQSLLLNPGASYNYDGYIGVPFLSGISVSAGSSGVSAWDIFQEGGDINSRIDNAIRNLDDKDVFTANQQLEILSVGWLGRDQETFYSAGLYQETDFILYFPKDFAELAYNGNADFIGQRFNFSDIAATAEVLTAYHFGVNKKVSPKLRVGARAKIYMSILNGNSTGNSGFFRTRFTPEGPNFFTHEVADANVQGRSSGLNDIYDEGAGTAIKRALFSPNLGLGFDLGFTYDVTKQWSLSASLLDIGFIAHTTDLRNVNFSGNYEFNGIELEFPALVEGQETTDYWEIFLLEAEEALPFEDFVSEAYTTLRPLKLNTALNYGFGENRDGECNCLNKSDVSYTTNVGLHINAIKRPRSVLAAATLYYDKSWWPFLKTKITYTVDTFSKNNIGLLVSTKIKNFNFYIAGDNLLEYADVTKARQLSVQMGMQVVINQN